MPSNQNSTDYASAQASSSSSTLGPATPTTFTPGSVLFAGAAGVLSEDNPGIVYANATNQLRLTAGAATDVPLLVKGAASQSGNLLEVNSSAGSAGNLFRLDSSGRPIVGGILALEAIGSALILGGSTGNGDTYVSGGAGSTNIYFQIGRTANCASFDVVDAANTTRMQIYDVTAGSLKRVSIGAADSGGAGFKVLRIPN